VELALYCPVCGREVAATARICPGCGEPFED
jgi:predicted amidophosphoribosyltransferase